MSNSNLFPDPSTLLIGGEWQGAANTFEVVDPATMQVIGVAADGEASHALAALEAATAVFPGWRATPAEERARLLRAGATLLRESTEELAELMTRENGKPLAESRGEVIAGARMIEWASEEGRRSNGRVAPASLNGPGLVVMSPVGPALAITPWNFPASMLLRKVGLALAAGCPLIVKPAEQTPLIATALLKLLNDELLPAGVLQQITTSSPADIVTPLLADDRLRKVSFTGSTEVGLHLIRSTGDNLRRTSLEMGGHSPAIVFDDVDIEAAASAVVATKFANAGQSCISINRLFVHESIHDAFVGAVVKLVDSLVVGHGLDSDTAVGPLIDFAGLDKVERHVADAVKRGAELLAGGARWTDPNDRLQGAYFEPTVLTGVDESMLISTEETFGPVLPIFSFASESEVISRANATTYGLAAYMYSHDLGRVWRVTDALDFGVIGVNDPFPVRPELPFGGQKNSGQEREGGSEGIEAYLEPKSISIKL